MLFILHAIAVLLFVLLGVLFWNGKGSFLIAGYNAMPSTEKEHIGKRKLCKFMGKFMFACAACWSLIALNALMRITVLLLLGNALFFSTVLFGILCANTGNRFQANKPQKRNGNS